MKVRASLKKRTPECKIVRRNGRLYVINKKNPKYKHGHGSLLHQISKSLSCLSQNQEHQSSGDTIRQLKQHGF